jgi:hypothetical protein
MRQNPKPEVFGVLHSWSNDTPRVLRNNETFLGDVWNRQHSKSKPEIKHKNL